MTHPWLAWVVVAVVVLVSASVVSAILIRRTVNGRASFALGTRGKLRFFRLLARDPRTPRASRWLIALVILYLISPIDIVSDFIPVLGQADDVAIVLIALCTIFLLLPRELVAETVARARDYQPRTEIANR